MFVVFIIYIYIYMCYIIDYIIYAHIKNYICYPS